MNDDAEKSVSDFYNTLGWKTSAGITVDARNSEDLRGVAREYVEKCRMRVLREIPKDGEYILDMASGPIQYTEYLEYSKGYRKRYCIDLSSVALEEARKKIGEHGEYLCGNFLDIPLKENFFDCSISLHTIYHMDKDRQEEAIRKLIYVTKPRKPIIVVYSNPNTFASYLTKPFRKLKKIYRRDHPLPSDCISFPEIYFYRHSLPWWKRFNDVADVCIKPWRSFDSKYQKLLIPENGLGKMIFNGLYIAEESFPKFFSKHFQYIMVVLRKKV